MMGSCWPPGKQAGDTWISRFYKVENDEVTSELDLGEANQLNGMAWTSNGNKIIAAVEGRVVFITNPNGEDEKSIVLDNDFKVNEDTNNAMVIGLSDTSVAVLGNNKMVKIYNLKNL